MSHLAVAMERVTVKSLQFSGGDGDVDAAEQHLQAGRGSRRQTRAVAVDVERVPFMAAVDMTIPHGLSLAR